MKITLLLLTLAGCVHGPNESLVKALNESNERVQRLEKRLKRARKALNKTYSSAGKPRRKIATYASHKACKKAEVNLHFLVGCMRSIKDSFTEETVEYCNDGFIGRLSVFRNEFLKDVSEKV